MDEWNSGSRGKRGGVDGKYASAVAGLGWRFVAFKLFIMF